ncbi:MAG: lytic transglycosylase domain-containing protein [bacterium]|nr:lytic transglycosylase domain-containing protein [bacterium]
MGRRFRRFLRRFRLRRRRIDLGPRRRGRRRFWPTIIILSVVIAGTWWWIRRPLPPFEETKPDYYLLVVQASKRVNLPSVFIDNVIMAESSRRPEAVSPLDAKGLMQIMPAAETDVMERLNLDKRGDLFDPEYNLLIGTTYLRMMADRFNGDAYLVLGAYHMGPTRVSGYLSANPGISGKKLIERFAGPATRAYCAKILQGKELRLPVTPRRSRSATRPAVASQPRR